MNDSTVTGAGAKFRRTKMMWLGMCLPVFVFGFILWSTGHQDMVMPEFNIVTLILVPFLLVLPILGFLLNKKLVKDNAYIATILGSALAEAGVITAFMICTVQQSFFIYPAAALWTLFFMFLVRPKKEHFKN